MQENGYRRAEPDAVARMLADREGMTPEYFEGWIQRFCTRKWNSDFSVEMSRSCRAMLEDWCGEKID